MSEFIASYPWALPVLFSIIGFGLGVFYAQSSELKKSGGRTVQSVQKEMDDYKEEVGKHFATTSELFRDMTEKYRDVYNHLASGSQDLCDDEITLARLEFAEAESIAADDAPAESSATGDEDGDEKGDEKDDETADKTVAETAPDEAVSQTTGADANASESDLPDDDASDRHDPPLKS